MNFDQVGCGPLDPHVLLFNRIFKTGSSTTEFITKNNSNAMNYDYQLGQCGDKWVSQSAHSTNQSQKAQSLYSRMHIY